MTHSLVGVLIARSVSKDRYPQAVAVCVVAANVPDIDIVTLYDPATYLTYHRHLTHALLAIPVMAALALSLVAGWRRLRNRNADAIWQWRSWALALIAAGSLLAQAVNATQALKRSAGVSNPRVLRGLWFRRRAA